MRQLRRWKRLWRRSLICSHKRTSMGPSRSCCTVEQVHCSRRRLIRSELEFHMYSFDKSGHTKKVWKLYLWSSYVYIYIYIYIYIYMYIYIYIYIYILCRLLLLVQNLITFFGLTKIYVCVHFLACVFYVLKYYQVTTHHPVNTVDLTLFSYFCLQIVHSSWNFM